MAEEGLSTERAKELIGEVARLKPAWVIIEGGEPLLRGDIFELLELMQQEQLEAHLITGYLRVDQAGCKL
jgi:organic radical activating enzyme